MQTSVFEPVTKGSAISLTFSDDFGRGMHRATFLFIGLEIIKLNTGINVIKLDTKIGGGRRGGLGACANGVSVL